MNDRQKKNLTPKDILIWIGIFVILGGSLYVNYHFSSYAFSIRVIGWIAVVLISLGFASLTTAGNKAIAFSKEARIEMRKVVWPNRQETVQTTMIVVVMVMILGMILWAIDSSLLWSIGKITKLSG